MSDSRSEMCTSPLLSQSLRMMTLPGQKCCNQARVDKGLTLYAINLQVRSIIVCSTDHFPLRCPAPGGSGAELSIGHIFHEVI